MPPLVIGDRLRIESLLLRASQTEPPPLLSESDLIALMDRHGIGTDATIAELIKKVQERQYIVKSPQHQQRFMPTNLGLALVRAFEQSEVFLARPTLRAQQEQNLKSIATGALSMSAMLGSALTQYRQLFAKLRRSNSTVLQVFGNHFSPRVVTWAVLDERSSRCGACNFSMQLEVEAAPESTLVASRHQRAQQQDRVDRRLHCTECDTTYRIPAMGQVTVVEHTCPLCNFQVLNLRNAERGTEYKLCPKCFSHPPSDIEALLATGVAQGTHPSSSMNTGAEMSMRCFMCPAIDRCVIAGGSKTIHPAVRVCPWCAPQKEAHCALIQFRRQPPHRASTTLGTQTALASQPPALSARSTLNAMEWRLACVDKDCEYKLTFPKSAVARICVREDVQRCHNCKAFKIQIEWKLSMIPPGLAASILCCVWCDPSYTEALHALGEEPSHTRPLGRTASHAMLQRASIVTRSTKPSGTHQSAKGRNLALTAQQSAHSRGARGSRTTNRGGSRVQNGRTNTALNEYSANAFNPAVTASHGGVPQCEHGIAMRELTCKNGANQGRVFYKCAGETPTQQCRAFAWKDELTEQASHSGHLQSQTRGIAASSRRGQPSAKRARR